MIATAHRTTHFRPRIIRGHAELPPQGRQAYHGLGMATATRQMRDRVERIMKEGLACLLILGGGGLLSLAGPAPSPSTSAATSISSM